MHCHQIIGSDTNGRTNWK